MAMAAMFATKTKFSRGGKRDTQLATIDGSKTTLLQSLHSCQVRETNVNLNAAHTEHYNNYITHAISRQDELPLYSLCF
jgi:hypothetical protein